MESVESDVGYLMGSQLRLCDLDWNEPVTTRARLVLFRV